MSEPTRSRVNEQFGGTRDAPRPPLPEPLPSPVVDNHCHLDIGGGDTVDGSDWLDPAEALELAAGVGVPRIVQIGCDLPGAAWAVETATTYDAIVAAVAIHPNEAPRLDAVGRLDEAIAEIERLVVSSPRVRAVGETGLDYYRTGPDGVAAQRESFAAHIRLALTHRKALVIHDRDAHDDVLAMLDEHGVPGADGPALLLRRCGFRSALPRPWGLLVVRGNRHLQERPAPARRACRHTFGPDSRRDGRSVPDADALPRTAERVIPGPADRARHGGGARGQPGQTLPGDRRQYRCGVRGTVGRLTDQLTDTGGTSGTAVDCGG